MSFASNAHARKEKERRWEEGGWSRNACWEGPGLLKLRLIGGRGQTLARKGVGFRGYICLAPSSPISRERPPHTAT